MRGVLVGLLIALLVLPAQAQRMRGKQRQGSQPQQTAEQKKNAEAKERAYKDALDKIPAQKPADPWGHMR